jgi:hypothetical protein
MADCAQYDAPGALAGPSIYLHARTPTRRECGALMASTGCIRGAISRSTEDLVPDSSHVGAPPPRATMAPQRSPGDLRCRAAAHPPVGVVPATGGGTAGAGLPFAAPRDA